MTKPKVQLLRKREANNRASRSQQRIVRPHRCPNGFICGPDAAKILGVSLRTIRNWQERKLIPYYKLGHFVYFKPDELLAQMELGRVSVA